MAAQDDQETFPNLRPLFADILDSPDSWLSKQEFDEISKKIDQISDWVEEQKKAGSKDIAVKENVKNICKIATATANAIPKFQGGNTADVVSGTMDIVASVAVCVGAAAGPIGEAVGVVIGTICSIIGAIFTANKPTQPSVVEQLAEVVHKELVDFNKKLQDQKYNGLKDRVSTQKFQLQTIKAGEKLADPDLWINYVQFLGELSNRFESPLPFKYEKVLTKDADVADFVTAVATYCQAYNCFMALMITAIGKFAELKDENNRKLANDHIKFQRKLAIKKLAFLSDKKYLTFVGKLPCAGGKLTKIVALCRNFEARAIVEMVTRGLGLPNMPDLEKVEFKAEQVSLKSILQPEPTWSGDGCEVQFINKTKFLITVNCATVGKHSKGLKFTEEVHPGCSIRKKPQKALSFSVGGYIVLSSDDDSHKADVKRSDDDSHKADVKRSDDDSHKADVKRSDDDSHKADVKRSDDDSHKADVKRSDDDSHKADVKRSDDDSHKADVKRSDDDSHKADVKRSEDDSHKADVKRSDDDSHKADVKRSDDDSHKADVKRSDDDSHKADVKRSDDDSHKADVKRSDNDSHKADVKRVIEFAMSASEKINIQDKTGSELTKGQDTYEKMKDGKEKSIYWMINDKHHMAHAEILTRYGSRTRYLQWRFIVRDFVPSVDVKGPPIPD